MTAKQKIRRTLPGTRHETRLFAEDGKELWHVLDIRGCFDVLVDASCYQIRVNHILGGQVTTCYGTIEQARAAWPEA
jgi:hypothetical protein